MITPAINPVKIIQKTSKGNIEVNAPSNVITKTIIPAEKIPVLNDHSRLPILAPSFVLTRNVPIIELTIPIEAIKNGRTTASLESLMNVALITKVIVAIIEPT